MVCFGFPLHTNALLKPAFLYLFHTIIHITLETHAINACSFACLCHEKFMIHDKNTKQINHNFVAQNQFQMKIDNFEK